jgi:hypothetical protein
MDLPDDSKTRSTGQLWIVLQLDRQRQQEGSERREIEKIDRTEIWIEFVENVGNYNKCQIPNANYFLLRKN